MFFSVKNSMRIANKEYVPCVCYPVNPFIEATVAKLEKDGKAFVYAQKVTFVNGKAVAQKAEAKVEKVTKKKGKQEEEVEI